MITLDYFCALASLVLQLKGRLEEVGVQPRCSIQTFQHTRRLAAIEATVSHKPSDDRAVLLLDESLIILLVGARTRHLDLLRATPGHDDVVHERAVIVEIGAANEPGEQVLCALHGPHDEAALARHQRHALGPTSRAIDHGQCLDKRASHGCAAMSHHVDLAEPRRRIVPVVERPDWNFTPYRRNKSRPAGAYRQPRQFWSRPAGDQSWLR